MGQDLVSWQAHPCLLMIGKEETNLPDDLRSPFKSLPAFKDGYSLEFVGALVRPEAEITQLRGERNQHKLCVNWLSAPSF
jgi:hypothetical protein